MQEGFFKKYINIYFWQAASVLVNMVALFIVVPYISKIPSLYGAYTFCVSFNIFFAYADLGFVSAGYKYAAEAYALKNQRSETEITAFVSFILTLLVLFLMVILSVFVYSPGLLHANGTLDQQEQFYTSRLLLLTLLGAPNNILQRILQITFGIRLEDYKYQRINVIFNILKVLSVFIFFSHGKYDIVGYYATFQILSYVSSLGSLFVLTKLYRYDWKLFFRSFRFSKKVYSLSKSLAFGSLWVTICWIIYYELDSLLITRLLGYEHLATYAIGLSLTAYCRTLAGIIYTPFGARFNHFAAGQDMSGLSAFYKQVLTVTLPFMLFPVATLIFYMKPFVLSWAGHQYIHAIGISQILVSCYLCSFIISPSSLLVLATHKIKMMYWVNALMAFVFLGGVLLTVSWLGVYAFAIFKLVAITISTIFYVFVNAEFLKISGLSLLRQFLLPATPSILAMGTIAYVVGNLLPAQKSIGSFIIVVTIIGLTLCLGLLINFLANRSFRASLLYLKSKLFKNGTTK